MIRTHGPPLATMLLEGVVAARPEDPDVRTTHAESLLAADEPQEALDSAVRAVELDPDHLRALRAQGTALVMLGRADEALAPLGRAVAVAPGDPLAGVWHAVALLAAGRPEEEAVAEYARATALDAKSARHLAMTATRLNARGLTDRALWVYEHGVRLAPADAELVHLHTAAGGAPVPERAAPEFVRSNFDAYAKTFDEQLRFLGYALPEMLVERLAPHRAGPWETAIDLGCGTGLCGLQLRPHVTRLEGVDLAPKMVAQARSRGVYDELRVGDLAGDLAGRSEAYDVAVAADVLIYFGALDEAFAAVAGALRPGGLFTFSVEADDGDGYVLRRTGRYAHGLPYLRALASAAGLAERSEESFVVRRESGRPIGGTLMVLAKP